MPLQKSLETYWMHYVYIYIYIYREREREIDMDRSAIVMLPTAWVIFGRRGKRDHFVTMEEFMV